MPKLPLATRPLLLALVIASSFALAACGAETPARSGTKKDAKKDAGQNQPAPKDLHPSWSRPHDLALEEVQKAADAVASWKKEKDADRKAEHLQTAIQHYRASQDAYSELEEQYEDALDEKKVGAYWETKYHNFRIKYEVKAKRIPNAVKRAR